LGRRFGAGLVNRWSWSRRRLGPALARAEERFATRGGWAIFGARWVGALRAVVPLVAGSARMPVRRFLAWNAVASVLWASAIISLGYVVGRHVGTSLERVGAAVSVVVVTVLVVRWWRRRHRPSGG
jgi:membrane protein DedA with SNARE-associated domain